MNNFVSVSGGLDSTALSIICSKDKEKEWKYVFSDTGDEFPQVHNHLDKMESVLNIKIERVKDKLTLEEYEIKQKYFPSYRQRFCTRMFKIEPIEKYLRDFAPFELAIGLRADEKRKGNIADYAVYPLQKMNIHKCDVLTICQAYDLTPQYPWYMARGGCYSCFFKSKNELLALAKYEPELFNNLIEREEAVQDNRKEYYTMFDKFEFGVYGNMPLRKVKEEVDKMDQVEIFDIDAFNSKKIIYESYDCGTFCRK